MFPKQCDLLFAGAGLSGLTLALELLRYPAFQSKKIVLIDRDNKTGNDRTWCFWTKDVASLPPVLHKTWEYCHFYGPGFESRLSLTPYTYCMVRGIDFYRWARATLLQYPGIEFVQATIVDINPESGLVTTDIGDFQAEWILNSAFIKQPLLPPASALFPNPAFTVKGTANNAKQRKRATFLLQHFKGWVIETIEPVFDPETATLMDYRIDQKKETRFVYVLPFSPQRALVEFTVFSPALCPKEEYDLELLKYIQTYLQTTDFRVLETEFGVIPMADFATGPLQEGRVVHIGTGAGFVKASSGYAFTRTRRKLARLAREWAEQGRPDTACLHSKPRYRFFDSVLLRVLDDGRLLGATIFTRLFARLRAPAVFRFLDEDSAIWEDLRLMRSVPQIPFLKAAWQHIVEFIRS